MLLIVGTIRLPASNLELARPLMMRVVEGSRAEPECVEYIYAEDMFEPGLIHIKERWTDQAALDRHAGSDHIAEWRAASSALGVSDRNLLLYEVEEPRKI